MLTSIYWTKCATYDDNCAGWPRQQPFAYVCLHVSVDVETFVTEIEADRAAHALLQASVRCILAGAPLCAVQVALRGTGRRTSCTEKDKKAGNREDAIIGASQEWLHIITLLQ